MTLLLSVIVTGLAVITLLVAANMLFGPFLARTRSNREPSYRVSVCIPARNEARNIGTLLTSLNEQDWPLFEVLVLDDESSDATADLVLEHASLHDNVTLLRGTPLPAGWTGKNWACHQLSRRASGDVLLFVDADVLPFTQALRRTVNVFTRYKADVVSAFPGQVLQGLTARLVIPVMDVLLYAFLPLQLVHRSRHPSLAAANGQWLAFKREAYDAIGGHEAVRGHIVEDIRLAQRSKEHGLRMVLTSGVNAVQCRMYASTAEVIEGFSKNFFAAFDFRVHVFIPVLLLLLLFFVFPYVVIAFSPSALAFAAVALNVFFRAILSLSLRHGLLTVVLHPVGILFATGIGLLAVWKRFGPGNVQWKGRDIPVHGAQG
jgi:chlorobactene glucosyltransferase